MENILITIKSLECIQKYRMSDIGNRYKFNISIKVEGAFAVLKECMDLRRLRNKLGNTLHQLKDLVS